MSIVALIEFLLKWSLFCARALERHRLLGRNLLLSIRRFMCSQNREFWFILVFGKKRVGILPAVENFYGV